MTFPHTFAPQAGPIPLAYLDDNFNALTAPTGSSLVGFSQSFAGTAGSVARKLQCIVSPRDAPFNAVGDGVADDTAAVSAMLSAYTSASTEFNGEGMKYKLTSTISKTLASNVHWRLKDFNFTSATIAEPGTENGVLNITGDEVISASVWSGTNTVDVDNVMFTDARAYLGTLDGLVVYNCHRVALNGVRAYGYSNTGIYIGQSHNIKVSNCEANGNMYAGLRQGSNDICVIEGGVYNNNGISAPTYGYGLASSAGDGINAGQYITCIGVTANGNLRKGIDFHAGVDVSVLGCTVVGYGNAGIYAVGEASGKTIANVSVVGNFVDGYANTLGNNNAIEVGAYGLTVQDAGDIVVAQNRIRSSQVAGSSSIFVYLPSSGTTYHSISINNNTTRFGSSSDSPIVNVHTVSALLIDRIKINDNILHSTACTYGINAFNTSTKIKIDGNLIQVDSGTVTQGIYFRDDTSVAASVDNNQFLGAATYGTGTGIFEDYITQIITTGGSARNNRTLTASLKDVYPTGISYSFGTAAPVSASTFNRQGSQVVNSGAAVGSPKGWSCTVSGQPGTWVSQGNL